MFVSYFLSGFIPLSPYLFFETGYALPLSIFVSLVALFVLGAVSGKISGIKYAKSAFRMLFVGGIAIAVGIIVGRIMSISL